MRSLIMFLKNTQGIYAWDVFVTNIVLPRNLLLLFLSTFPLNHSMVTETLLPVFVSPYNLRMLLMLLLATQPQCHYNQQTSSCFGGLPDVTEHTHNKNGKRVCKFNKQQLPPLLETLTSNESLPSLGAAAAAASLASTTANPSILVPTAALATAVPQSALTKQHSFDIFDTKPCFFSASTPVARANSALTLCAPTAKGALPEALLACSAKGLSPTGSLKYGIPYGSGYCSPSPMVEQQQHRGLGICGLTTLRIGSKYEPSGMVDGAMVLGSTDLNMVDVKSGGGQPNGSRRGSGKSCNGGSGGGNKDDGSGTDRRWCLFIVTFFIALTVCVLVVSFVLEVVLGDHFVDKSSDDFRLKTIRQLLRETPLIGECHTGRNPTGSIPNPVSINCRASSGSATINCQQCFISIFATSSSSFRSSSST